MDLSYLDDPRLSWKAKGLYSWLLTQPPGTPFEAANAVSSDESDLIEALEELANLGFVFNQHEPWKGLGDGGRLHEA